MMSQRNAENAKSLCKFSSRYGEISKTYGEIFGKNREKNAEFCINIHFPQNMQKYTLKNGIFMHSRVGRERAQFFLRFATAQKYTLKFRNGLTFPSCAVSNQGPLFDVEHEAFEIFSFGVVDVDGMIGRLMKLM